MENYEKIFENNRAWVKSKLAADEHFCEKLAKEQKPHYL